MRGFRSRRTKALVGAVVMAAVLVACGPRPAPAPASCPQANADALAATILNRVNYDRSVNGLGPLHWNGQLACLAAGWSSHMAGSGSLVHRDLNATIRSPGYSGWRTLGENILRGPVGMTGEQMEASWLASAPHRANILSRSYHSIGIGWAVSPDGRTAYATQNFGG